MVLHHPGHSKKDFSVPRGVQLALLMVPGMFLFWVGVQGLVFQSGVMGKALVNCTHTVTLLNKLLLRKWRPAAECQAGDIKEQEKQQEGGWKPVNCNKNSSLPDGSPAHSMGLFGARAEGDGRM